MSKYTPSVASDKSTPPQSHQEEKNKARPRSVCVMYNGVWGFITNACLCLCTWVHVHICVFWLQAHIYIHVQCSHIHTQRVVSITVSTHDQTPTQTVSVHLVATDNQVSGQELPLLTSHCFSLLRPGKSCTQEANSYLALSYQVHWVLPRAWTTQKPPNPKHTVKPV